MESKKEITAVDYDSLLKIFLSEDDFRPAMQQANSVGDKTYATDGTALIIIPNEYLRNEYPAHVKTPNYKSVLDQVKECGPVVFKGTDLFKALQVHPKEYDVSECETCEGYGRCPHCGQECNECDGKGTVEDHYLPMVYSFNSTIQINRHRFTAYRMGLLEKTVATIMVDTFELIGESGASSLFQVGPVQVLFAKCGTGEQEFPNIVLTPIQ